MRRIVLVFGALALAAPLQAREGEDAAEELKEASTRTYRAVAVRTLTAVGPRAFPHVVEALGSRHVASRRVAARLLAEYAKKTKPPAETVDALVRALTEDDAATRAHVVEVLGHCGPEAVRPLMRMLRRRDATTRRAAARALAAQGPAVVAKLVDELDDGNRRMQWGAMRALGWFPDPGPEAFERMKTGLGRSNAEDRAAAAFGLRGFQARRAEALKLLAKALRDEEPDVAASAASAAANHGAAGVKALVDALGAGTETQEMAIERALIALGDAAAAPLEAAMSAEEPARRAAAARVLGGYGAHFGYSPVAKALRGGLGDDAARVRVASARSLRRIALDAARLVAEELATAARDGDIGVRAAALAAYERVAQEERRLVELAERAMKHHDPRLRAAGAYALVRRGRLPADEAAPIVHLAVADPKLDAGARAEGLLLAAAVPGGGEAVLAPATAILRDDEQSSSRLRVAAALALGEGVAERGHDLGGRARRFEDAEEVAPAVERALSWLAKKQGPKGVWPARALGAPHDFDVGITAMATLAFLGAGRTGEPVRKGVSFLMSVQKPTGEVNQFSNRGWTHMCEHAWATLALCEASALLDDPRCRKAAEAAIRYCERARNPHMAWRYEVRGGENDTHITVLMTHAMRVAVNVGLEVDWAAFAGARSWTAKLTDPNFGQTGYNYPGGTVFRAKQHNQADRFPAERSQAMTAAGILIRTMTEPYGNRYDSLKQDEEMNEKSLRLCLALTPTWDRRGSIDMYYWHFGTLALAQLEGKEFQTWWEKTRAVLGENQRPDGSWPPAGAWGMLGGRGYSTAIGALTLLAPIRYPRWREAGTLTRPMKRARDTLHEAARRDPSPFVRDEAYAAALRIENSAR